MTIHRSTFSIEILAKKPQIWEALWNETSYRKWAGVFYEGSYIRANHWEVGNTVMFLGPDHNGIYSTIEKHLPNELIQFRHVGNVVNRKEQPLDDEAKKWSGATEIYRLTEGHGHTMLTVDIDIMDEHLEYMSGIFPKALEKIKSLAENG